MIILYIVCGILLLASLAADREKTLRALKIALKKFLKILPAFGIMLVLISIVLFLVPQETIIKYLGSGNSAFSIAIAALAGSVALFPGFIAYPLCGVLLDSGVSWSVIAAFSISLMLVGVVTFPVEKSYLGVRTALIRNITAFLMVLIAALFIGLFYGEFPL